MARRVNASATLEDLIYFSGKDVSVSIDEEDLEEVLDVFNIAKPTSNPNVAQDNERDRQSMYVMLFERMGKIVLKSEAHLLSPSELLCLDAYNRLSYRSRFLLVRLALRKHKIHRLSRLAFQSELGPYIPDAMAELCQKDAPPEPRVKVDETEVIDLTLNDDDDHLETIAATCKAPSDADLSFFAEDDSRMTLSELLGCLTVGEMTAVAKELKLKTPQARPSLIAAILQYSSTQGALHFPVVSARMKGKQTMSKPPRQSLLPFKPLKPKSVIDPVRSIVLKILNTCIRLNPDVVTFFRRLNIIFFRDTQLPDKILTPSLLACVKKRFYPSYTFTRTSDIWKTRDDLLNFEKALELEAKLSEYLDTSGGITGSRRGKSVAKAPTPRMDQQTKVSHAHARTEDIFQTTTSDGHDTTAVTPGPDDGKRGENSVSVEEDLVVSPRVRDAMSIKAVFESVYEVWKALLSENADNVDADEVEQDARRRRGLRRYECGHVYTRIVHKGAEALGILKEYQYELKVLETLLSQRRWKRGSRGAWYDRRALLLMTHLRGGEQRAQEALDAVVEGLQDDDTHIIYRPKLERRLATLERRLKIPEADQHTCIGALVKPQKVFMEGIRVQPRTASLVFDSAGRRVLSPKRNTRQDLTAYEMEVTPGSPSKSTRDIPDEAGKEASVPWHITGKSVWVGRDGENISVEILALQEYESHGYKGFHCESRIVTTLFGLLFWDILFANVPGALETPWQSAPMDIAEDSFYFARKEIIERRLSEIEDDRAPTILTRFDDLHRKNDTWCVGVRWDLFEKQDLVEIVECIGGKPLSVICRLLAEDYASRTSGVPDLIVWRMQDRRCMFVEVKGPGDSERENQKIWMDVLLRAGIIVEVCRVEERGHAEERKDKKTKARKRKTARRGKVQEPRSGDHETVHESDDRAREHGHERRQSCSAKRCAEDESSLSTPVDASRHHSKRKKILGIDR